MKAAIVFFVITSFVYLAAGIAGLVLIILNHTDGQVIGGVVLVVGSAVIFYGWAYILVHYYSTPFLKNPKISEHNKNKWTDIRLTYPFRLAILYALLLIGIAIIPDAGSPDRDVGVGILVGVVPLFALWWGLEFHAVLKQGSLAV